MNATNLTEEELQNLNAELKRLKISKTSLIKKLDTSRPHFYDVLKSKADDLPLVQKILDEIELKKTLLDNVRQTINKFSDASK